MKIKGFLRLFRGFVGDEIYGIPTQLCGDYFINHDIRIPGGLNNQDASMESVYGRFFFVAQVFVKGQ